MIGEDEHRALFEFLLKRLRLLPAAIQHKAAHNSREHQKEKAIKGGKFNLFRLFLFHLLIFFCILNFAHAMIISLYFARGQQKHALTISS